jgi:hypothetical protein
VNRFEWNGLRRGDAVAVHLGGAVSDPTAPASVRSVDTRKRADSAISLQLPDHGRILWPARSTVHRTATDPTCWRCNVTAAAAG